MNCFRYDNLSEKIYVKYASSQSYGFSRSHIWMWELDYKEISMGKLMLLNLGNGENSWVSWIARRSNQSILKDISPEYSLERLRLKLKLQYFGHLLWRTASLEKTLRLGQVQGRRTREDRGWDGWMASPSQWIWVWVN